MRGMVDFPFTCEGYVLPDERVRMIAANLLDSIQRFNANAGGERFAEGALVFETLCVLGALGRRSEPRRQDGSTRFSLENPPEIVALWQLMSRRAVDGGASTPEQLRAILEALLATWRTRG